jgi:hypothetical protein
MGSVLVLMGVVLLFIGIGAAPNQYKLPLREALSITAMSRPKAVLFGLGLLCMVVGTVLGVAE